MLAIILDVCVYVCVRVCVCVCLSLYQYLWGRQKSKRENSVLCFELRFQKICGYYSMFFADRFAPLGVPKNLVCRPLPYFA